jgi:hypothetical protein
MDNLEQLITEWRKTIMESRQVEGETVDELETHLRENVDQFVRSGMTETEAFQRSVAQLGGARMIASEFHKLDQSTWLPVKLVAAFAVLIALALMIFAVVRLDAGKINLLLASHGFLVGVGYSTTFLIGALGVCFVGQRCFGDFSRSRTRSVTRVTFALGCIAASMTAAGIILGMIWAKIEWGRYWAWDNLETGAFAIMTWQVFFLFAHRFPSARGVLTMTLLGNIVVSLGWFGPKMLSTAHSYGPMYRSLLFVGIISNLVFLIIGLAPAGWIRLRKA